MIIPIWVLVKPVFRRNTLAKLAKVTKTIQKKNWIQEYLGVRFEGCVEDENMIV